jgi:hypothetical protein
MEAIGLTNLDVQILDDIMKKYDITPDKNITVNNIYKIVNDYKKTRVGHEVGVVQTKKKLFSAFVKYCLHRNLANFDTLILITADKGTGKSSTAIQMARNWCKLIGIKFKPKRHIAYNNADMIRCIDTLNKFEPLIADEAIRFATSEDWAKAENKELKKKLGQVRTKHLFYILCFPLKVTKLEKTYLNSYVDYWIDLFDRGKGALFIKDKNPSSDVWNIKKFEKLGNWNEFTSPEFIEKTLSKHPNFWKIISVPSLHKSIYDKYLKVRESNVYDDENAFDAMTKDDYYRAALLLTLRDIVTRDGSLQYKRILKSIYRVYGIEIPQSSLNIIMEDANQLIKKINQFESTKNESSEY